MELLPSLNSGYSTQTYWEDRYAQEEDGYSYDWFKSYAEIEQHLARYIQREDRIIMLGCGNSTLSAEMHDDGYQHITNIDFSPTLIERMRSQHEQTRPSLQWIEGDIKSLTMIQDESFDIAIDKGTMDALMALVEDDPDLWNPSDQVKAVCRAEMDEAMRILKPNGKFIYITFGQPHFRLPHLKREGCKVETIQLGESFHYYFYVVTKHGI